MAVGRDVYFGATDGRLFSSTPARGRIRWAYDTGGRINSSPSILRNRIFISTYAGSIWCLRRNDGHKIWCTTSGVTSSATRASTRARRRTAGGCSQLPVGQRRRALRARRAHICGRTSVNSLGYATPAVAHGRVFVGGFDGRCARARATTASRSGAAASAAGSSGPQSWSATSSSSRSSSGNVRAARHRREGRLAARHRQVLARDRHRAITTSSRSTES